MPGVSAVSAEAKVITTLPFLKGEWIAEDLRERACLVQGHGYGAIGGELGCSKIRTC
jgi:hypothetical protein